MDFRYNKQEFDEIQDYLSEAFDSSPEGLYFKEQYIEEKFGSYDDYLDEYNNHEVADEMEELGFEDYDEYQDYIHRFDTPVEYDDEDLEDMPFYRSASQVQRTCPFRPQGGKNFFSENI